NPKPQTPNPKPQTPNPTPQTPNPTPQTSNTKPQTPTRPGDDGRSRDEDAKVLLLWGASPHIRTSKGF
ncbi:hypothetical protein T484DRAFT_1644526, partial [Baffinella frigidus]